MREIYVQKLNSYISFSFFFTFFFFSLVYFIINTLQLTFTSDMFNCVWCFFPLSYTDRNADIISSLCVCVIRKITIRSYGVFFLFVRVSVVMMFKSKNKNNRKSSKHRAFTDFEHNQAILITESFKNLYHYSRIDKLYLFVRLLEMYFFQVDFFSSLSHHITWQSYSPFSSNEKKLRRTKKLI